MGAVWSAKKWYWTKLGKENVHKPTTSVGLTPFVVNKLSLVKHKRTQTCVRWINQRSKPRSNSLIPQNHWSSSRYVPVNKSLTTSFHELQRKGKNVKLNLSTCGDRFVRCSLRKSKEQRQALTIPLDDKKNNTKENWYFFSRMDLIITDSNLLLADIYTLICSPFIISAQSYSGD